MNITIPNFYHDAHTFKPRLEANHYIPVEVVEAAMTYGYMKGIEASIELNKAALTTVINNQKNNISK